MNGLALSFSEAHALEPNARTLRGMGVAAFQAGNLEQAVIDLSASLEHPTKPLEGELRAAVVALLAEAQAKLQQAKPQQENAASPLATAVVSREPGPITAPVTLPATAEMPASPSTSKTPPPADHEPLSLRQASRATLAIGGLVAVGAGALWITGALRVRDIERACETECSQDFVAQEVERADLRRLELGFNVMAGSAAVILGTSFGVWLWSRRAQKHSSQFALGNRSLIYTALF